MSGKRSSEHITSAALLNRHFYIHPSKGASELKTRIASHSGIIDAQPGLKSVIVISPQFTDQITAEEIDDLSSVANIYSHEVVDALIEDPEALNDEQFLKALRKVGDVTEPLVEEMEVDVAEEDMDNERYMLYSQRKRETENRLAKKDKRRLFQPDVKDLKKAAHRNWMNQSEESYIKCYYTGLGSEKGENDEKSVELKITCAMPPPYLPGAPESLRKGAVGNSNHDLFWAPPIALYNCVRAADPLHREFMLSEDYAIFMWYVRTIPYCGVETPVESEAQFRYQTGSLSPLRWNWARTHGIALRSLSAISERWRRHIVHIFLGREDIPGGTFRRMLAQTQIFYFQGNRIIGYKIRTIKALNDACRLQHGAPDDGHVTMNKNDIEREDKMKLFLNSLEQPYHTGDVWITQET